MRFFSGPTLNTEEETRQARLFHHVVIVILVWLTAYVIIQWIVLPQNRLRWAVAVGLVSSLSFACSH